MSFETVILCIVAALVVFGIGFCTGRFIKAWRIGNIPIVGKIIIDGDELYLSLDGVVDLNDLRQHGEVAVNIVDVKTRRKNSG